MTPSQVGPENRADTPRGGAAWIQCLAGASGDMLLGALIEAGAPLETVQAAVDSLGVDPVLLHTENVTRHGVAATRVNVKFSRTTVVRTWGNIRGTLIDAELSPPVRAMALEVFSRLARAEAAVHRTAPEQVHFHELGALDALADVVGACAAWHALGLTYASASAVAVGSGMTRSEHGLLPVPAPAVVALLSDAGAPMYSGPAPYEMCTPTGAALLTVMCGEFGPMPLLRVTATGVGAGSRDLDEVPNVLRVFVGQPVGVAGEGDAGEGAVLVEANIDDLDPRLWPPVLARLLEAGAADAWLTPIVMKKGRPAYTLSVLAAVQRLDEVRRVIFTETSTIGLREQQVGKRALARQQRTVSVDGVAVRVKTALLDGVVVNAQPEYEDVVAAAEQLGRPVKAVLAAANAAAHEAGIV